MRRIINSTYISLDGVVDNFYRWPSVGPDDAHDETQLELLRQCDAILMGRRTYEGFAPAWQARSGDELSERFNSIAKYVVSSTLRDPEWNNTSVISSNVAGELKRLKDQPGKAIVQYGFGQLTTTLIEHGMLDELRLWVYPLIAGSHDPQDLLFRTATPLTMFDLVDTDQRSNGIIILTYQLRQNA
jgi:dihydrofolate reductase